MKKSDFKNSFLHAAKAKYILIACIAVLASGQSFAQSTSNSNTLTGTLPSSPAQFLGSSNVADVLFKSSGVERMRMLSTGNIGIGVTAPTAALQIGTTGAVPFFIQRTLNQLNGMKIFFTSNPATGIVVGAGSTIFQNTSTVSDMLFMPTPTNFGMVIKPNGFVGIGTTSPSALLHLSQTSGISTIRLGDNVANGAGVVEMHGDANQRNWVMGGNLHVADALEFTPSTTGGVSGTTFNTPVMTINANGKVLIGNAGLTGFMGTPGTYLLYVQQGILTEKVKVAVATSANWADYVFAKDYKLKTIEELELFVQANNHLPNIPTAEEVVKQGIDMATMDAKLLEKIEELSLYVIELNKQIELLKKK